MSEEIHEVEIDRTGWKPGPWDAEPNRWEDRELGFPVLALRNSYGVWCGYVGVPPGHPWHGRDYSDLDVAAHGGLTYGGVCNGVICHVPREGEPAAVFWLGFDCNHSGDLAPTMRAYPGDVYRTLAYVQEQTRGMAVAAAAAAR